MLHCDMDSYGSISQCNAPPVKEERAKLSKLVENLRHSIFERSKGDDKSVLPIFCVCIHGITDAEVKQDEGTAGWHLPFLCSWHVSVLLPYSECHLTVCDSSFVSWCSKETRLPCLIWQVSHALCYLFASPKMVLQVAESMNAPAPCWWSSGPGDSNFNCLPYLAQVSSNPLCKWLWSSSHPSYDSLFCSSHGGWLLVFLLYLFYCSCLSNCCLLFTLSHFLYSFFFAWLV